MTVQTLGRYRIERELGRGAMGRVFLAYDTEIERRVAIKTFHAFESLPASDRKEARDRFLREARAAGRLLHPGIVTIFDVGEAEGVPYLAMEHVEGATLDAFCRDGELLPPETVAALIAHAAEALAFAHARGIVHRDVKPANLMRVGGASVKIMDFGLAKSIASTMTHDGALFGTPNYMSPEQVRGETLDGRSDLFSLGVVLFEMLTGAKPFAGDSVSSVLYRIVHEPPRDVTPLLDRVPAGLRSVVERALSKRREDRFEDGLAMASALRRAVDTVRPRPRPGAPLPAPREAPTGTAPVAPSRTRAHGAFPYVAGAAILLGAAAVILVLAGRGSAGPAATLLEARVRTEPPGLAVALDGAPVRGGVVRFDPAGPFGLLTASQGCRQARHRLEGADAGREIVLALDPARAEVEVDAGTAGAKAALNGAAPLSLPATLDLDLCRENRIDVAAPGFREAHVIVPAESTPLAARTAVSSLRLERIPMGRLLLPRRSAGLELLVDGRPIAPGASNVELTAGTHELRARNERQFVDLILPVEVPAEGSVSPSLALPPLATLVVQTFPAEARVSLARVGGSWRRVGETPLRTQVAAGAYTIRVEDPAAGTTRERRVVLHGGANPPVRISLRDGGR